jgi:tetratricopeptide (TPR) repeat protein
MRKIALLALLVFTAPAGAATPLPPAQIAPGVPQQLDKLFKLLPKAGSADNARPIEARILSLFAQSGSPSIDLLMARAQAAAKSGDNVTAGKLLESVTDIAPGYAEGWHARAQIAQAANSDQAAIAYFSKALALNPRQFQAASELAQVLMEYGDKKQALQYMRRAQSLDPFLPGMDKEIQKISRDVEGEKI